nr:DDB1 and CUL4 associated factor 12 [Hymenolepis microstoma]
MKRKIERCNRRKRSRSDAPTVLRIGVGDLLSRLDPNELSPRSECQLSEPQETVQSSEYELISEKYLEDLRKASGFCQELLRILKKLDQLRSARIGQLRGQGRSIPEEINSIFTDKKAFILNELESTQVMVNKLTMRIKDAQRKSVHLSTGVTSDSANDDDIIPKSLPPSVRYALFGSFNFGESTRWNRFYSQCNRNFSDFVRIRSNWDKFMVSANSVEASYDRHPPSKLPITWELPPSSLK